MKKFVRFLGIFFLIDGLISLLYAVIFIGYDLVQLLFFGLFGILMMFIGNKLYYWNPRLLPKETHDGRIKFQYNSVKIVDTDGKAITLDSNRFKPGTELKLLYDKQNEKELQIAVFYKKEKIGFLKSNKNVHKKIISFMDGRDRVRAVISARGKANCDVGLYR